MRESNTENAALYIIWHKVASLGRGYLSGAINNALDRSESRTNIIDERFLLYANFVQHRFKVQNMHQELRLPKEPSQYFFFIKPTD